MKQKRFYTELAYILGLVIISFGVSFMTKADFGLSMVVAPAYIIHMKVVQYLPFFTFGTAEYCLQGVLLIAMMIVLRKVRLYYFFSFVTAVLYGFILDGCLALTAPLDASSIYLRILYFIIGMLCTAFAVALMFRTYIAAEVYELFVIEISKARGLDISRFKTIYDCTSCLAALMLSFVFFGLFRFVGVNFGTIICALVNGRLIGLIGKSLDRHFIFCDALPLRRYFE